MTDHEANRRDSVDHLPEDLLSEIARELPRDRITAATPYDLDRRGRYLEGYLVLSEDRLGGFRRDDGRWLSQWHRVEEIDEVRVIDGLGLKVVRLLRDDRSVAEFRCTLRHAKSAAALARKLERLIDGKEALGDQPPEPPRGEEKKIRCDKCNRVIPPWSEFCPACTSSRKVLGRLLDYVRPYRTRAVVGLLLALLVTAAGLARPAMSRPMTNEGLGLAKGRTADYGLLMSYVGVLIALTVVGVVGQALRMRIMAGLGARVARDIRDTTYRHMHKLSLSFFSRKPTGSLITRITSDSERVWDFVAFTIVEAIMALVTIAGVGFALFWLNWRLACFVLIPIPLMLVMMVFFHKRMHGLFKRIWHRWSQMTAVVSDALPGVRVIKAFGQERREVDRFGEKNAAVYDAALRTISVWTMFGPVLQFCSRIGSLLVWIVGGYWVVNGQMDPGTLIAYIGYMWMFYGPIHMIAHMDRQFNRAATSVQRIFEILDTEPAIFSRSGAHEADRTRGEIELRNVSFSYDGVRTVLKNINLKIAPGEMIGLAGPSGGGKTTTVNLICRFYDVLEGRILIDGVDVRDYDVEELRRQIGLVLQEPFLFHGTVAQNIAYGNPSAAMDEIIRATRAANAHDFIVGFPDGYDTLVGERGHTLSGGERQRISIARAILNDPKILILDEATSSVDTETEKLIQEALERLVADRTTIAIAHRLSTLRKAGRLVILDKGEIIEQGTHEELATKEDGLYARLLRMQHEMQSVMAL